MNKFIIIIIATFSFFFITSYLATAKSIERAKIAVAPMKLNGAIIGATYERKAKEAKVIELAPVIIIVERPKAKVKKAVRVCEREGGIVRQTGYANPGRWSKENVGDVVVCHMEMK